MKRNDLNRLCLLFVVFTLTACEKGDSRLSEVRNQELQEEVKVQAELSAKDEKGLERLQRFYQGVAGTYIGTAKSQSMSQQIQLTLLPSLPPTVQLDRVRTRDEIAADITGLTLTVMMELWTPSLKGKDGCELPGIKARVQDGKIEAISNLSGCRGHILIQIDQIPLPGNIKLSEINGISRDLSHSLMTGQIDQIRVLNGQYRPTSGEPMNFTVERIAQ